MPKASEWINYLLMIPIAYVAQVLLNAYGWHHSISYAAKDLASFEVVIITALIFVGRMVFLATRKPATTTA